MRNNELQVAHLMVQNLPCVGFELENIKKIVALTKELEAKFKDYQDTRKKIFESCDGLNGSEQITSEQFPEQVANIMALDMSNVAISGGNFLTGDDLDKCVAKLPAISVREYEIFADILVNQKS